MKQHLRSLILGILIWAARVRLRRMRRQNTQIIGITGSIGKTTCKEAVAHVLRGSFHVLNSEKSYNTEFGLPLTILGLKSEFSSVAGWAKNILLAVWRGVFDTTRYDFLILEMGVDKPGDMDQLLNILSVKSGSDTESEAPLHYAIFTGIHAVHLADGQFASLEAISKEKGKIMSALPKQGIAFINADDVLGNKLADAVSERPDAPKIVRYGTGDAAKLRSQLIRSGWAGLEFTAEYGEVQETFHVPILGEQHIGSLLPAIGCGLLLGMYMHDIADHLKNFHLPPGRLSLIEAKNDAWILDSSYNASPDAVRAAVETMNMLAKEKGMRRVFVFGNMNELGVRSLQEHADIGKYLSGKIDMLITVGEWAAKAAQIMEEQGLLPSEAIRSFPDSELAATFVEEEMQKNDLILVKGSQNKVRLERLVRRIMKAPEQALSLLARQDWA